LDCFYRENIIIRKTKYSHHCIQALNHECKSFFLLKCLGNDIQPTLILALDTTYEIKDHQNRWYRGRIISQEMERVQVHYDGFADKYDDWINRSQASKRFAKLGTRPIFYKKESARGTIIRLKDII